MTQLKLGAAPAPQQQSAGSTTNTQQRSTIRVSVPWTGSTRPVEGRKAKLLVYSKPVTQNARKEDVFGVAIAEADPVSETAHRHQDDGSMPSVKEGVIERIWPARDEGGFPFVTLVPVDAYLTPKAVGEELRFLRSTFDAVVGAWMGQDYEVAETRLLELATSASRIAGRIQAMRAANSPAQTF